MSWLSSTVTWSGVVHMVMAFNSTLDHDNMQTSFLERQHLAAMAAIADEEKAIGRQLYLDAVLREQRGTR
jgi:hypothetical protein